MSQSASLQPAYDIGNLLVGDFPYHHLFLLALCFSTATLPAFKAERISRFFDDTNYSEPGSHLTALDIDGATKAPHAFISSNRS